jgi:hypothetical protein
MNQLSEQLDKTFNRHRQRQLALEILLMIQPVFHLPLVSDKYGLIALVPDLPLIRLDVLN